MNRIDPRTTALLIINMTNDLIGWDGVQPLVPRLERLLERAREASMMVVFSSLAFCDRGADSGQLGKFWAPIGNGQVLVKGTAGVEILRELAPQPGEPVLQRNRYSAFFNSDLDKILRDKGIRTLIIAGYSTNFCCDSTARDANFRDYNVIVLEDGTAPIALQDNDGQPISAAQVQKTVLANLGRGFAQIATVDEVISALGH
ncbi:MAG TPA: isochorismatase family cysteine hydrolase [Candidatus Binataceae bacterium]|nr:isochorismatase family cysteine hydrolase [Candidatus Binataceae bacterium]